MAVLAAATRPAQEGVLRFVRPAPVRCSIFLDLLSVEMFSQQIMMQVWVPVYGS